MQQELINDLAKTSQMLDAILLEDPNHDPQNLYAYKIVTSSSRNIHLLGLLLITLTFALLFATRVKLNRYMFKYYSLQPRDSAVIAHFLVIALVLHYLLPRSTKTFFNFYGAFDYVDLDKLIMQILVFQVIWTIIGVAYHFIHAYTVQLFEEYEAEDVSALYRIFENMYLYGDPNLGNLLSKVQYHAIRQQFLHPTDVPLLGPRLYRQDYNFALYLSRNQNKLYASLLRINSFTAIPVLVAMKLNPQLLVPIISLLGLLLFYFVQAHNVSQMYLLVHTPGEFKPISMMERGILTPPIIVRNFNQSYLRPHPVFSEALNLRILHSIIFTQAYWFAWLFYAHRSDKSLLDYTITAIFLSISCVNVFFIVPNIVGNMTYTHKLADPDKVALESQYSTAQLFEQVSHYLRGIDFNTQRMSNPNDDKFSMTEGQKALLRFAFKSAVTLDQANQIESQLKAYKQELEQNPDLLLVQPEPDLELKSDAQSDILVQEPIHRTIQEQLEIRKEQLVEQFMNVSEESQMNQEQLIEIFKLLSGNLPLWYHVMISRLYFNSSENITFESLVKYSAFNIYCIEYEELFPRRNEFLALDQVEGYFGDFFSDEDVQRIIREYAYKEKMLNFQNFVRMVEDFCVYNPL